MNLFRICLLIALIVKIFTNDIQFLNDYYLDKNAIITASVYWNYDKMKLFLNQLNNNNQQKPYKLVNFYNNPDEKYLHKLNTNHHLLIDLQNYCNKSFTLLDLVNQTNLFTKSVKLIILTGYKIFNNFLIDKLNSLAILPSSDVLIAIFFDDNKQVELLQPYKTGIEENITWENYGNWSIDRGLFENFKNIPILRRRSNLKRVKLTIPLNIGNNDTWNHLTDYKYPQIDTFLKQDFATMVAIFEYVNITCNLVAYPSFGYYNKTTKRFNHVMNALDRGGAHIGGSSMFFTEERYTAVDFIKMGNPLSFRFIVRKPSTSYMKNIFWITFQSAVWLSILFIISLFSIALFIALNLEKSRKRKYTISDVTLIGLEAVCQQGTTTEPNSISGRLLTLILFMAFMFLYVSYSANIVVLLQSTTKINNLIELLESRIEVGGQNTVYMKDYFEKPKSGVLKDLYQRKIYPTNNYYSVEKGMRKLQEGNFAYHVELITAYNYVLNKFTNYEICGLQELPGYFENNKGYIPIAKNSPYKEIFKIGLLKVDEYGLQRRTNKRIIMKPICFSQIASFKSVGIYDCHQIFWIWSTGSFIAFAILILEIVINKIQHFK